MLARRALLFAFLFSAVTFSGFFPPENNPNELSRIEAVVAFVESGTFSIDRVIPRLGDTVDKSVWRGRYYSNKAPGLIFAAVPVYRVLRIFFVEPRSGWSMVFVLMRLATVTLASVAALAAFSRRLEQTPEARDVAPLVAFAAAFGTSFLFYSRSFFSHAWTASFLFLSWDLLRAHEEKRRSGSARLLAAGFLAGWAAISEYTVAPIALALALRAAVGAIGRPRKALLLFAAGMAPALLLLAVYDVVCFGSPFRISSACEAFPAYTALGHRPLYGLGPPVARVALATLFSTTRGAILFSPFLLWAAVGWVRWWRSGWNRRDCVFTLAACLLLWLPITGYPNWEGGWSLGMRYLLPVLFFAAFPVSRALASPLSRGLFLMAVVFSASFHLLASFTWPHFPVSIRWPAANVSAWLVARGAVAPNLGLGLGLTPLLSLLPALVLCAAALGLCARKLPVTRPGRAVACVLGLAAFTATLVVPPSVSPSDASLRAALAQKLRAATGR